MAHLSRLARPVALSISGGALRLIPPTTNVFRSSAPLPQRNGTNTIWRSFHGGASSSSSSSSSAFPINRRRLLLASALAGGVSLYILKSKLFLFRVAAESSSSSSSSAPNPWELSPRPAPTPSRVANYGVDLAGMKFTLYQYQTCPFCCKARVFLDYYGISYDVVEVNSVKRTEIKWSKYKKVPLLMIETPDGQTVQLNDSSQIISVLKTFIDHKAELSIDQLLKYYPHFEDEQKGWLGTKSTFDFPNKYFVMYFDEPADETSKTTSKARSVERKWRSWVDSDFVHRISPNIYGTFKESLQAFRYFDQVGQWDKIFSSFDRMIVIYLGAFVMRLVSANLKKKHELDDDVRYELNASVNRFVKSALKSGAKRFAGGDRVSLADLALYGAMTSFQGCGAFQDMINANDVIKKWFYDVQKAVDSHEGQAAIKELKKDEEGVVVVEEAIVE